MEEIEHVVFVDDTGTIIGSTTDLIEYDDNGISELRHFVGGTTKEIIPEEEANKITRSKIKLGLKLEDGIVLDSNDKTK